MTNNIKELRTAAGLTQAKLSELSGVSKRTIEDWEAGRRLPRDVYVLHNMAKALECAIEDLINFDEQE